MRRETLVADCNEDPDPSWVDEFPPDDELRLPRSLLRWLDEIRGAIEEQCPPGPAKDDALLQLDLARRPACWQRFPQ